MESFLGDSGPYLVLMKVGPHFKTEAPTFGGFIRDYVLAI